MWSCKFLPLFLILLGTTSGRQFRNNNKCYLKPLIEIANKYLVFQTIFKGNFYEASNFCRSHCMHLISIESEAEQKGITKYLKRLGQDEEKFWTAGNNLARYEDFLWLSTGRRMTYTNWANGEPKNDDDNYCVYLKSGTKWSTSSCSNALYFICEIRE